MSLLNKETIMTAVENPGIRNVVLVSIAAVALVGISAYGLIRRKKNKAKVKPRVKMSLEEEERLETYRVDALNAILRFAQSNGGSFTYDDGHRKVKISAVDPELNKSSNLYIQPVGNFWFYVNTAKGGETEKLLEGAGFTISEIYKDCYER